MKLLCDDREDGAVLLEVGDSIGGAEIKRLLVGDYVCDELGVCFERKTIDDFCGSIVDGRVKRQCEGMLEEFKHCFVLISGRIGDRKSDIGENCVLGMISSLVVMGIQVVCVDDDKQLVYLMKRILERFGYDGLKKDIREDKK